MKYWFPYSSDILWGAIFLALMLILNVLSVKSFGEAEFWFAGIKVITIIIFLVIGLLMILGIFYSCSRIS